MKPETRERMIQPVTTLADWHALRYAVDVDTYTRWVASGVAQLAPVAQQLKAQIERNEAALDEAQRFRPSYAPAGRATRLEGETATMLRLSVDAYRLLNAIALARKAGRAVPQP